MLCLKHKCNLKCQFKNGIVSRPASKPVQKQQAGGANIAAATMQQQPMRQPVKREQPKQPTSNSCTSATRKKWIIKY